MNIWSQTETRTGLSDTTMHQRSCLLQRYAVQPVQGISERGHLQTYKKARLQFDYSGYHDHVIHLRSTTE